MWMGRPLLTVSLLKIRRKSCGENEIGLPSTSVISARRASFFRSWLT
jgi:hypothetical protein